jgi:hypothetical protein
MREFWSCFAKNCPYCDSPQMKIRKDGNSKLFKNPLPIKVLSAMKMKQMDNVPTGKGVKLMHPFEVRNELRQLWEL